MPPTRSCARSGSRSRETDGKDGGILAMKLIGNLKKQVENEGTKEGRKKLIEKAGMKLTDDELEKVAGGEDLDMFYGDHRKECGDEPPQEPNTWLQKDIWEPPTSGDQYAKLPV